jgi:hypothetical protein
MSAGHFLFPTPAPPRGIAKVYSLVYIFLCGNLDSAGWRQAIRLPETQRRANDMAAVEGLSRIMDEFVPVSRLAAELGLSRADARQFLLNRGIRPQKVRVDGFGTRPTFCITRDEARHARNCKCEATDHPDGEASLFFVIRLVPDLDPRRIKIGLTTDTSAALSAFRVAAPTAELVKCWPCRPRWAGACADSLTAVGCRPIGEDVYDCQDIAALVVRADTFFSLLPSPTHSLASAEEGLSATA